jgi:predicted Fe-Mo cluster-binding NifX family protein
LVRKSLQGKGPVYVFGDAGVEIIETRARTLSEAIEEALPETSPAGTNVPETADEKRPHLRDEEE